MKNDQGVVFSLVGEWLGFLSYKNDGSPCAVVKAAYLEKSEVAGSNLTFKEKKVLSLLTCSDLILWGTNGTER